jgi:beta-ribofuranosylaminobenzene 5'-phosphate synthase
MNVRTIVNAPARLHLGLFDLGHATRRSFGGVGFMIDEPRAVVEAIKSDNTRVYSDYLSLETTRGLQGRVEDLRRQLGTGPVAIFVRRGPPEHIGLGSKTCLTLACLTAASTIWDRQLSYEQLQRASGRGGASGIGVTGFFTGGFVIDAGHKGKRSLLPSARHHPTGVPPAVVSIAAPGNWLVTLFMPSGKRVSGEAEVEFFRQATPIPRSEILEQMMLAYHELAPAVMENDIYAFGAAMAEFIGLGFKAREISNQSPGVSKLIADLSRISPCVGMSSMGPLVFTVSDGPLAGIASIDPTVTILGVTRIASSGFQVSHAES